MSEQAFRALFREIDPEIAFTGNTIVHMVFEEPAVTLRASLSSDERQVVTDIYLFDVASFEHHMRNALLHAVLTVNDLAAMADNFSVSVDARGMLMLTGRARLDGITADQYGAALAEWLEQAASLHDLAETIGQTAAANPQPSI